MTTVLMLMTLDILHDVYLLKASFTPNANSLILTTLVQLAQWRYLVDIIHFRTRRRKCCIPGGVGRKWAVCPRIGSKSIHSGRLSDHRDYEDCCRSSTPSATMLTVVTLQSVNSVNLVGDNGSRVADQWFNGCRLGFLADSILFTIQRVIRRKIICIVQPGTSSTLKKGPLRTTTESIDVKL